MQPHYHAHPQPKLKSAIEIGAFLVTCLLVLVAPLQILLTLAGAPGGLFVCSAFFTLVLALPVLMLTAYAPPVTVSSSGITLHPRIWKDRFIPWDQITAVKRYPLLPTRDTEPLRPAAVGRRNYQPAEGIMLVIPGLPPHYRIAGFLAGERAQPVIALTNRAHTDYTRLQRAVLTHVDTARHDLDD